MSERPTKVPSIPAPTATNLLEVARAVKGVLDVREGLIGDELDAFVKIRDLEDDLFRSRHGVSSGVGGDPIIGPTGPAGPPGSLPPPDLTPPPAPTGLTADPTLTSIILQWDSPPGGYAGNHAYTEIWRSAVDLIGGAVLIGTSVTQLYADAVGEAKTGYFYWVRFMSDAAVPGPYNATSGVFAQTSPSPAKLLELLQGQITTSQLYIDLAKPIHRIDELSDSAAQDAIAAALAVHKEASSRGAALVVEAAERGTAITEVKTLIATGDEQLAQQIVTLTAAVNSGDATSIAAVEAEALARANADSAEAISRETLAAQMRGTYTGTDVAAVTTGLVFSERQARTTAVSAQATRIDGLEASVDNPTTGLLARATALETVTTNVTSGNSALSTRTGLLEATVDTPSTGLVARATALETVTTHATSGNSALASRSSLLEASVNTPTIGNNPTYAGLQTEASVRAALDGSVQSLYTVRTEVTSGGRTVVGGFGLAGTATASEGPRIDFGVRADRFWIGAPSTDGGISDVLPFVVQTTPTTINGEAVAAGVYMDTVFLKNGTIGSAKIGSLTATKITAGYTTSVDLEAGTFAGSEFYIGGTITYEFGNPSAPTQKTGIAGVANPNVALNADGATFNADYFRVLNSGVPYVPFEVAGGVVRIKAASIGDAAITSAKIADTIQSTTFNSTAGWQINKAGGVTFNEASIRGAINGGAFTGYAWPVSGTGYHLSASGLLLGRYDVGNPASMYFQYDAAAGAIYSNKLSIVGGDATFSGTLSGADGTFGGTLTAQVVNTSNIVGSAVTSGYSNSSAGFSTSVTVTVPTGATSMIVVAYLGTPFLDFTGSNKDGFSYTNIPGGSLTVNGSVVTSQVGTLVWSTGAPAVGTYSVSIDRDVDSGVMNIGVLVTKR